MMAFELTQYTGIGIIAEHVEKGRAGNASPYIRRRHHSRAFSAAFSMVGRCGSRFRLPLPTGGLANPLRSATRLQAGSRVHSDRRRPEMPWKPTSELISCSIPGCEKPSNVPGAARGFCANHYARLKRTGDPLGSKYRAQGHVERWVQEIAIPYAGNDCLIWPFVRAAKGYAHWTIDGRPQPAARVICRMVYGDPPTERHVAAHNCFKGHTGCVNPRHLRWATASENEQDKIASGTSNRGSRHGMSKLTDEEVIAIRSLAGVMTQDEIGQKFGVSKWAVGDIIRRKRWGWLV